MSLLNLSVPRLEAALKKYVRPNSWRFGDPGPKFTVRELTDTLLRRGMNERDVHSLCFSIIQQIEPEPCYMTHCKMFGGTGAPMNCGDGRVPGRCSILRDFKQRKAEREKAKAEVAP